MKFCLYEILNSMAEFRDTGSVESEALIAHLEKDFGVKVEDEGLLEATFVTFINTYCG
jgi:hypothetical protein